MKNNIKNNNDKIEYTYSFKVKAQTPLLEFLLQKNITSRNNIKMLLKNHQILVNGTVITQFDYSLSKEDEIKISKKPIKGVTKFNQKNITKPKLKLEIIYEDDYFIAINKPNGLLSVQSDNDIESAYSYVATYLNNFGMRPYIIHRIDKETSGVLVFAKDAKIQSKLRLDWDSYVKYREYYAICIGKLPKKSDRVILNLKENENNMVYVSNTGKKAITNYEVIKENKQYSLVKTVIETGRKNQIRVTFKYLGAPIVGDQKYQSNEDPISRLGLHASELILKNPITGEDIKFRAKIPNSFNQLFK